MYTYACHIIQNPYIHSPTLQAQTPKSAKSSTTMSNLSKMIENICVASCEKVIVAFKHHYDKRIEERLDNNCNCETHQKIIEQLKREVSLLKTKVLTLEGEKRIIRNEKHGLTLDLHDSDTSVRLLQQQLNCSNNDNTLLNKQLHNSTERNDLLNNTTLQLNNHHGFLSEKNQLLHSELTNLDPNVEFCKR